MTLKNNPEKAIAYYQEALEKLPDDVIIRRKIAHTHYLLRNWKSAYEEYSKVPLSEIKDEDQKELFQSLFFDESRLDRLGELSRYHIDPIAYEYYNIVDTCYSGIHNCIVSIEAYTGQSTKVRDLAQSIKNSTQISPDFQYRNFLVAAQFYEYGMYRVTDILTNEILLQRPNYNEVKKLR
jgi:tetratricopeptide (TPR) repeat protein